MVALDRITVEEMRSAFADLESLAIRDLRDEGFASAQITLERSLDLRYAGQGYELTIPCGAHPERDAIAKLRALFDETHRRSFGHIAPDETVEIVSFRVRGTGRLPPVGFPEFRNEGRLLKEAQREIRRACFGGIKLDCPVYQREDLDVGQIFDGPAIIDQLDATTVVLPSHTVRIDEFRNLLISRGVSG
jgi:N-methylhydantoinase A